jgi:thiol:disulfide interchange protein DsbD
MHKSMIVAIGLTQLTRGEEVAGGHARVALLVSSSTYQSGKLLQAAVSIEYEPGWHGYWVNPGEGGMKTEVKWALPPGWTAGPLEFPVPHREMTGGLSCYGYAGKIIVPVHFSSSADAHGDVEIQGKLSWLACSDKGCVPGDAELKVKLGKGAELPGADAELIHKACEALPASDKKVLVTVSEKDGQVKIGLTGVGHLNLEGAEIFPITEQALDSGAPILLKKSVDGFEASVKKNEYAKSRIEVLELIIAGPGLKKALLVSWNQKG